MTRQSHAPFPTAVMLGLLTLTMTPASGAQAPRNRITYPRSDVTLETVAVTYPNEERAKVSMFGTDRFNSIKGTSVAARDKGKAVTMLKLDLGRMPHPSQVCQSCATYVVWAITPEGQTDNLGEFRKRGSHTLDGWLGSDMETSTRHQTFSLIITAEPYYLVASPSRYVVATNADTTASEGGGLKVERNLINFSGDSDFDNKIVSPPPAVEATDKKYPVELRQARLALEIANYYQAGKYDQKTYRAAETSYQQAAQSYAKSESIEAVRAQADLAIRQADMARRRAFGLARAERERQQLQERDDALAALDLNLREKERSLKEVEGSKQALAENNRRLEADMAAARERVTQVEARFNQLQAATTRLQTALEAATAEKARAEAQLTEYGARCNQSVKCIEDADLINKQNRDRVGREFSVTQGELGIVLTLAERPFNAQQPTAIAPGSLLKLDLLADYLKRLPNQILIETFGQGCGSAAACQSVTETWAQTLARHLEAQGVPMSRMTPVGRGAAGAASAAGRGRAVAAAPQVKVTIRNE